MRLQIVAATLLALAVGTWYLSGEAVFSIKIGSVATALIFIARHLVSPALSIDRTEMQGKVVVITGANSGCGLEAARLLCSWNATVILACRDMDRAAKAAANIEKSLPQECTGKVLVRQLDLASMASVKKFAERFRESGLALHVLMCNAGFRSGSLSVTDDGIEMHYQVNHLSHFLLSLLLLPSLEAGARAAGGARVVHVSSSAAGFGDVDRDAYAPARKNADGRLFAARMASNVEGVYGDTKLMQAVISRELDRRVLARGVRSFAVHPGFADTAFGSGDRRWLQTALVLARPFIARDAVQGCLTQVYAAVDRQLDGQGGLFLDNMEEVAPPPAALDSETAEWLWESSLQLVGLPSDAGS